MSVSPTTIERPPVIAIMGHVDHGKSTLLDYIRKTNIVDTEAGGITQGVSAYEVTHLNEEGVEKRITFIDTPGHAAFSGMRARGADIADIAILIVAADDSVKAQTVEAIQIIKDSGVPFLVAINKVDKPGANPDKVKTDLMEHGIYLEGYGGDVPYAEISAKSGAGIDDLLETILLLAELQEFTGDTSRPAQGFVVESHQDPKRGITATLIIKDGTLSKGQFVVSGSGMASTRILEDFSGKTIDNAIFSSPVRVIGFSTLCNAGAPFTTYDDKKTAEGAIETLQTTYITPIPPSVNLKETNIVPVILKCDVEGMIEPLINEVEKLSGDGIFFKIIKTGVGNINESDAHLALSDEGSVILGFNATIDPGVHLMNGIDTVPMHSFSIIYKMAEFLEEYKDKHRKRKEIDDFTGTLRVIKIFSNQKNAWLVGGRVITGTLTIGDARIIRSGEIIGKGKVTGLQQGPASVKMVQIEQECGCMIETDTAMLKDDEIRIFTRKLV